MNLETVNLITSIIVLVGVGYIASQIRKKSSVIKNQVVVDTSGLIDGRLLDIVQSGFVPQRIIIPKFVVAELQFLADKADPFKRERARYGLEVVRKLQEKAEVEIVSTPVHSEKTVDGKLVELAKTNGALLYTTDYNLNQVAQIEGVPVLNVNELAQALRALHLPGEKIEIKLTQTGQDKTQGVGYMEDGTMVVVENASRLIGKKAEVELSRILQTQAGKMMFATLVNRNQQNNNNQHKQSKQNGKNQKRKP